MMWWLGFGASRGRAGWATPEPSTRWPPGSWSSVSARPRGSSPTSRRRGASTRRNMRRRSGSASRPRRTTPWARPAGEPSLRPTSLTAGEVADALASFVGEIEQVPPAFSAKKVAGERAYAMARRGEEVDLKPVRVHVGSADLLEFDRDLRASTFRLLPGHLRARPGPRPGAGPGSGRAPHRAPADPVGGGHAGAVGPPRRVDR